MSDERIKDAISRFLKQQGFAVLPIPAAELPTPDLLATRDRRYVIEIKTKEDDPALLAERERRLSAGEIVEIGATFTPQNTMSRVIKDGVKQLGAYPAGERDLALLWLLAVGADTRSQYEQWLG